VYRNLYAINEKSNLCPLVRSVLYSTDYIYITIEDSWFWIYSCVHGCSMQLRETNNVKNTSLPMAFTKASADFITFTLLNEIQLHFLVP